MSSLILTNQTNSPAKVENTKHQLYAKSDGRVYRQTGTNAEKVVGGSVLQVVQATASSDYACNTTTYTTAVSLNITPSTTNSKILILVAAAGATTQVEGVTTTDTYAIFSDSTEIARQIQIGTPFGSTPSYLASTSLVKLDSPSTTSQVTYSFKCKRSHSSYALTLYSENDGLSITAMEIQV